MKPNGNKKERTNLLYNMRTVCVNEIENKNSEKLKLVHHWIWIPMQGFGISL